MPKSKHGAKALVKRPEYRTQVVKDKTKYDRKKNSGSLDDAYDPNIVPPTDPYQDIGMYDGE